MKRLLFPLLATLAIPSAVNAEYKLEFIREYQFPIDIGPKSEIIYLECKSNFSKRILEFHINPKKDIAVKYRSSYLGTWTSGEIFSGSNFYKHPGAYFLYEDDDGTKYHIDRETGVLHQDMVFSDGYKQKYSDYSCYLINNPTPRFEKIYPKTKF